LLRAIMGLIPAVSGHIQVFGNRAVRGNPAIGYMPQLRSNIDTLRLNGWDFVASVVNGHRLGLPVLAREARDEVERVLDLVEARDLARRPLMEISGGERQRLLLAQALIGRPRLLLLDEPLISLDPRRQQSVVELVKRVQAALAIPVVFSSHELNPLLGAIDRVLYLGNGQAAIGTVNEVITGPILSKLYGSPISVVRLGKRIFVLSGEHEVERDAHRHEHDHAEL
jgi:zinc/manganese transport system ATP-binding protein